MRNPLASHTDDPSNELNFSKFLVSGIPEATEYLRSERFVFVGAPNRWRKELEGSVGQHPSSLARTGLGRRHRLRLGQSVCNGLRYEASTRLLSRHELRPTPRLSLARKT